MWSESESYRREGCSGDSGEPRLLTLATIPCKATERASSQISILIVAKRVCAPAERTCKPRLALANPSAAMPFAFDQDASVRYLRPPQQRVSKLVHPSFFFTPSILTRQRSHLR